MVTISNGFLKLIKRLATLCLIVAFAVSCGNESEEIHTCLESDASCRLVMNVAIHDFSGSETRGDIPLWKNGDRIFLKFTGDDRAITGRAIFDSELNEWKLSYDGIFPSGEYTGSAVFIDGDTQEWNDGISLGSNVAIYKDEHLYCEKSDNFVKVSTLLRPMTGRLRFHSSDKCQFAVSGIIHNYKMKLPELEFETVESPVNCNIADDGFSRYIYGSMPETSRSISVGYNNQLYTTTFQERILEAGISGYVELPNELSHSGWDMTLLSTPELGDLTIYDIGVHSVTLSSSIVNNGNGTVTECGFCYSQSAAPTINDAKVNCGRPTGGAFSRTVTGLEENTAYHVRAYAINESGVSYSEERIAATLAIMVPSVSTATVKVEDGMMSALFSAQIISDGNGSVSECGFCYSTNPMPDITDTKLQVEASPSFVATAHDLKIGTRYYVRSYAVNEKGVGYGESVSFIGGGGKPSDEDITRPNLIKRK